MPQFMNLGFTFDGLSGSDLGYYIVNMDSGGSNALGLDKSINEEDTGHTTKAFYGVKLEEMTFSIDIVKMPPNHSHYTILEITEEDIHFLNNWLIKPQTYRIFSSDQNRDVFYYAMFLDMKETRIGTKGYITLQMRLNSGFAYSSAIHHMFSVDGALYDIRIETKSTVDEYVYPDISFKTSGGNVTITNESIGESMILTNLPSGEYICYNEDMKHIDCVTDPSLNMRMRFNGNWLRLLGNSANILTITGDCEQIDIYFQNKIAIQH